MWDWAKKTGKKIIGAGIDTSAALNIGYNEVKSWLTKEDFNASKAWKEYQAAKEGMSYRGFVKNLAADTALNAGAALEFGGKKAKSLITGEPYDFDKDMLKFMDLKDQIGPLALGSIVQDEMQQTYIDLGRAACNKIANRNEVVLALCLAEKAGVRNQIEETGRILREGSLAVTSELLFHPYDSVMNMYNITRNAKQRLTFSPPQMDTIPSHIKDPVIIGIYHIGNKEAITGHAALWYRGQTIDSTPYTFSLNSLFHKNEATTGRSSTEWNRSGPFVFGTENCDFYIVDASKIGFKTPKDRLRFLHNISRIKEKGNWDLNSDNCAYNVNMATENFFLDTPRAHHPGLAKFDFPVSIGARLDRMCMTGDAFYVTPKAIAEFGQLLAMKKQNEKIKDMVAQNSDKTQGQKTQRSADATSKESKKREKTEPQKSESETPNEKLIDSKPEKTKESVVNPNMIAAIQNKAQRRN